MRAILIFPFWLLATSFVSAAYNATASNNVAVYWGQNSAGGTNTQKTLIEVCRNEPDIDIILLAFLTNATHLFTGLNFASSRRPLQQEIIQCQSEYNKTILLSLGGAVTDYSWSFESEMEALDAANRIWEAFGPVSSNIQPSKRPFELASVDGFDLDFEVPYRNVHLFAQELRDLIDMEVQRGGKKLWLSAAPQCPFPDANLDRVLQGDLVRVVDIVFIQFYNNAACDLRTPAGFKTSMRTWDSEWATKSGARIFMGVPGSPSAISPANRASYIDGDVIAADYIDTAQSFPSFAGVMVWDISQLHLNPMFLQPIVDKLHQLSPIEQTLDDWI